MGQMTQTKAVQDQPSMEEILASIRRIINDGKQDALPVTPRKAAIANDDVAEIAAPQDKPRPVVFEKNLAVKPSVSPAVAKHEEAAFEAELGIPELDSFLESLDAKHSAYKYEKLEAASDNASSNVIAMDVEPKSLTQSENDASISIIDEAIAEAQNVSRGHNKYESRFTQTDRNAFAKVGDALSASTATESVDDELMNVPSAPRPVNQLVSDNARGAVGLSFESLSNRLLKETGRDLPQMTEEMLKPMLADWLDNNLPSMVERLVRAEIERIARGN